MSPISDPARLAAQLRAAATRKAALLELKRQPPAALPDEVVAALRELLDLEDAASMRDAVVLAILGHPTESLRDVFEQLACREPPHRRAQALERLDMWVDGVALGDGARRVLAAAASAEHAWLRFLAAVQSARLGVDGGDGWQRAAKAIVASRTPDPMRCIRPQAEEQLSPDERGLVNAELRVLGAREL
jgi:hypothetical protein